MFQSGLRWAVARVFGVHHSTVGRLAERYHTTGSSSDRPRSGRPHVTTAAQDHPSRLLHLRDRFRPATRTAAETTGTHHRLLSARTIRNRLRADGIRPYRPYVGSVLTPQHCRAQIQWCSAHRRWTLQRWSRVVALWTNVFGVFGNLVSFYREWLCTIEGRSNSSVSFTHEQTWVRNTQIQFLLLIKISQLEPGKQSFHLDSE
uniref:Transposase Tc1-like domain-containing protein n=1 Tax=Sphaeramia orbicularis TaxID=375764 RepID=A0A672ZXQ3_9TELE